MLWVRTENVNYQYRKRKRFQRDMGTTKIYPRYETSKAENFTICVPNSVCDVTVVLHSTSKNVVGCCASSCWSLKTLTSISQLLQRRGHPLEDSDLVKHLAEIVVSMDRIDFLFHKITALNLIKSMNPILELALKLHPGDLWQFRIPSSTCCKFSLMIYSRILNCYNARI